ncbi:Uncharacterised protein [Enterobacter cloacae]|mgnify:FL=1|jgi:hypothetical protein|nr:hypothetical protein ABF70_11815 [Enterobacter hormaechei subsp. steigerwaltii]KTJ57471.1 hypothetical protein ASU81_01610 [Enterobacter hormaechei subsp. steigerwaltii]CZV57743.1 Uncharacterised protein [Enterobacter hormaechei]SAC60202.1 Uncharacterised protein [Enterobacter hormaechei]SAI13032.1 Uncharacterised protein [Enterobacter cloacae]
MAMCRLSVEIKIRWWVPVYLRTLTVFCLMMRCEPDYQKVRNFLVKYGISQKLKYEHVNK